MRLVLRFFGFATALASLLVISGSLAVGVLRWDLSPDLPDHAELAGYEPAVTTRLLIDPLTAYQVTSLLEGVVERTLSRVFVGFDRPLAGKTGTTNDTKDLWFVGSTPELAVGVFVGYDRRRSLGKSAYGSGYAAPIVRAFLEQALAGKPRTAFRAPVDLYTGKRSAPEEGAIMEAFKPGTEAPAAGPPLVADRGPAGVPDREAYAPPAHAYFR